MDILECITNRRSNRDYMNKSVKDEDIKKILQAAILAPSGKNGQPWKFKVLTDKVKISELCTMLKCETWIEKAPVLVANEQ